MTFQAWTMKFLNSMIFQIFHDLYKPCYFHMYFLAKNSPLFKAQSEKERQVNNKS